MLYPTELQARAAIIATYTAGGNSGGGDCARPPRASPALTRFPEGASAWGACALPFRGRPGRPRSRAAARANGNSLGPLLALIGVLGPPPDVGPRTTQAGLASAPHSSGAICRSAQGRQSTTVP